MAIALLGLPGAVDAQSPGKAQPSGKAASVNLEGSWSGGGTVTFFTSGGSEQARCRARYSRVSSVTYELSAVCATASARASQTATLRKVGDNRYSGYFHNSEYDVSGTISVVVHGRSQSVRLNSSAGSAVIRLSR